MCKDLERFGTIFSHGLNTGQEHEHEHKSFLWRECKQMPAVMMSPRDQAFDVKSDAGTFHVEIVNDDDMVIHGMLKDAPDDRTLTYAAAAPAETRTSVSASRLPFANKEQAFFQTPNTGVASVAADGSFAISLKTPGSYYAGLGTVLVRPTVFLTFRVGGAPRVTHVPVADPVAFRFGTYPMQFVKARRSPDFYSLGQEVLPRTQEQILRDAAYPNHNGMPRNFWGTKPPR